MLGILLTLRDLWRTSPLGEFLNPPVWPPAGSAGAELGI